MKASEAIQATAATSDMVVNMYLADLSDAELMRRPHPECNHLAWQLGHLVAAEVNLLREIAPDAVVELPEGFAEKHSKETTGDDDPSHFCTKEEYLAEYAKVRAASSAAIGQLSEEQLSAENPNERFREICPTVGAMCVLTASHPMMHVGQWVPVRRELDKPIVI